MADKVSRCVMVYTMGFEVLPVDAHMHRVAKRLGWTKIDRPEKSHDELEALPWRSWTYMLFAPRPSR